MIDHLFEIITSLLTIIAGGGWFVNWRLKKKVEKYSAYSDNVDLTEKIMHKYQETVLSAMDNQTSNQKEIKDEISSLVKVTSDIAEFLNGDFVDFQMQKKNMHIEPATKKKIKSIKPE